MSYRYCSILTLVSLSLAIFQSISIRFIKSPRYLMYQGLVVCDIIITYMAKTQECNVAVFIEYAVLVMLTSLYIERKVTLIMGLINYISMLFALFLRYFEAFGKTLPLVEIFQWFFPDALANTFTFIYVYLAAYYIANQFNKTINKSHNQSKQIYHMQNELILALSNILEANDKYTGGHIKRTSKYVKILAEKLKELGKYPEILTHEYVALLVSAAPLHDVGKITVPNTILTKAGKYTDEEYAIMKNHAKAGYELIKKELSNLENPQFIHIAGEMALYHHERWDGTGYPNGVKGEDIPLSGRIMAVADVLDALLSKRHYKEAFDLDSTFDIMLSLRGIQFEADLIDTLILLKDDIVKIMNE